MTQIIDGFGADKPEQPEYRIAISIYDVKTGETVTKATTFFSEESGVDELHSLIRDFNRSARRVFEAVHYPKEDDNN